MPAAGAAHFPESSARDPIFFGNLHEPYRNFLQKPDNVTGLFPESPARKRLFLILIARPGFFRKSVAGCTPI
jgi:hypothetical protein